MWGWMVRYVFIASANGAENIFDRGSAEFVPMLKVSTPQMCDNAPYRHITCAECVVADSHIAHNDDIKMFKLTGRFGLSYTRHAPSTVLSHYTTHPTLFFHPSPQISKTDLSRCKTRNGNISWSHIQSAGGTY